MAGARSLSPTVGQQCGSWCGGVARSDAGGARVRASLVSPALFFAWILAAFRGQSANPSPPTLHPTLEFSAA